MILFLCTVYGMTCQGKWSKTGSGLNWLRECWKKGEQKYDMDFTTWILYTHSTLILCCGMRDPCFVCGFIFMQSCVWKSSFETNLCIIFSLLIAFDKVETCRVTWETVPQKLTGLCVITRSIKDRTTCCSDLNQFEFTLFCKNFILALQSLCIPYSRRQGPYSLGFLKKHGNLQTTFRIPNLVNGWELKIKSGENESRVFLKKQQVLNNV